MLTHTLFLAAFVLVPVFAVGTAYRPELLAGIEHGSNSVFSPMSDSSQGSMSQVLFHRGSGRCPRSNPC
jgi:hypothetical protein